MSSDVPFHQTRMGQRFFEHTMPRLVEQLEQANRNLERLAEALAQSRNEQPVGRPGWQDPKPQAGKEKP